MPPLRKKIISILFILLFFQIFSCQKRKIISINNINLIVEIADTPAKRNQGLMYRKELDDNTGMLFVFDKNDNVSFWMKNTFIPLSIAFIDTNFIITEIQDMSPLDEETLHQSRLPIKYALEVNQGWFKKNNIQVGGKVEGIK